MEAKAPSRSFEGDRLARRLSILTGLIFVVASVPKFAFFGFELEQFERFELPFPEVLVILAGVVELAGGVALVRRQFVVPALAVLVPTMLVAIVSSGVLQGDVVPSLTVAPALLLAMLVLALRLGPRGADGEAQGPR